MKIKSLFIAFLLFFSVSLSSQEYGLVLSGGGGKGAYEVGVWKALSEYGFAQKVTSVSGSSVGGLNACLFACEPIDRVIGFWKVLVPEEMNNEYELISQSGLLRIINQVDFSNIKKSDSYPKVSVTATRSRLWILKLATKNLFDYSHNFTLNDESKNSEIKNLLLATSAFPILTKSIKLKDGHKYIDGGVSDNTPISPILTNENISQIFVVYLEKNPSLVGTHLRNKINVVDFIPSKNLGGLERTVDFSWSHICKLIDLGYSDTVKILENSNYYPVENYWFE